jgi:thymidylate kinase
MFGGAVFFTSDETKQRRRTIYKGTPHHEQDEPILATYLVEQQECEELTSDSSFVVLDRTWLSHGVEQNVKEGRIPTYASHVYPKELRKPDLVFQILIPEEERRRRVDTRGEKLTQRDVDLNEDPQYRRQLENERDAFGCVPLRLRLRDERTCALRAAQVILGHPDLPPLELSSAFNLSER